MVPMPELGTSSPRAKLSTRAFTPTSFGDDLSSKIAEDEVRGRPRARGVWGERDQPIHKSSTQDCAKGTSSGPSGDQLILNWHTEALSSEREDEMLRERSRVSRSPSIVGPGPLTESPGPLHFAGEREGSHRSPVTADVSSPVIWGPIAGDYTTTWRMP